MKPSEAFGELETPKAAFARSVAGSLLNVGGVRSVTFTGSFVEKPGLAGISDIDVVVVLDTLGAAAFAACRAAVMAISPAELGLPDHRLRLNDTFGPLKFDEPAVIVVHLMVYDLAGHREHVLKSPFTCLDWERSPHRTGVTLRGLYPTLPLQPRHFLEARRSLANYVADVASGSVSYRRYQFDGPTGREVLEQQPLDQRHRGEYAYHIVRNLVANYAKLLLRENRPFPEPVLLEFWRTRLPGCSDFRGWFVQLAAIKHARRADFPSDTLDRTQGFLAAFAGELAETWDRRAIRRVFVRHARTELNDGSFLGQGRDPSIAETPAPLEWRAGEIFSSPLRRCRETAAALVPGSSPRLDPRLLEINYGRAEGLGFPDLDRHHPEMHQAWARGEDPAFPGGENTAAVLARLESFLADLPDAPCLVVTHNVVLRCLLGNCLQLPMALWHRIPIDHLETFEVLQLDGVNYPNLTARQTARISDALAGHLL